MHLLLYTSNINKLYLSQKLIAKYYKTVCDEGILSRKYKGKEVRYISNTNFRLNIYSNTNSISFFPYSNFFIRSERLICSSFFLHIPREICQ